MSKPSELAWLASELVCLALYIWWVLGRSPSRRTRSYSGKGVYVLLSGLWWAHPPRIRTALRVRVKGHVREVLPVEGLELGIGEGGTH